MRMVHCMIKLRPDLELAHQANRFDILNIYVRQIEVDPNQLNISASINSVWCNGKFQQCSKHFTPLALVGCEQFKPERTGLIKFKCTWYKREWSSLAHTSALDFNKEGCVIQIRVD